MRKSLENFKFTLASIIVLALVGILGYWAFSTIESGSSHIDNQKQKLLENKNKELEEENYQLKRQLSLLDEAKKEEEKAPLENIEPVVPTPEKKEETKPNPETPTYKHQTLIDELQKLVNSGITLKLKSQGPAVGTVQKFLNIYNNTNNKVDNDYGAGTLSRVKAFQKAQGLTADGNTGPGTMRKMITWLKSR